MKGERTVAGLACSQVLAQLSAYLDGELDADSRRLVDAHLQGCDTCERFGGRFGAVVGSLRRNLGASAPVSTQRVQQLVRGATDESEES